MNTRLNFLLLLLICFPTWAFAQKNVTISGYVKDKESGETLIGATVHPPDQKAGTATNSYGYYSITLPAGKNTLKFSYTGYQPHEETIETQSNRKLNIELAPENIELDDVEVKARAADHNIKSPQMSMVEMDAKTLKKLPVIFGESDLMKSIQMMPGIQTPVEGSSGFSVRGGGMDQNLILLDEATVYNPSHLMGFFSVFNSDAIKDVTLYKGDIPASSGGRLSSLLDIQMKDGNKKDFGETLTTGL